MHDPLYEIQAFKQGYDPNLYQLKGEQPESVSQANFSHMQKMFLACTLGRRPRCRFGNRPFLHTWRGSAFGSLLPNNLPAMWESVILKPVSLDSLQRRQPLKPEDLPAMLSSTVGFSVLTPYPTPSSEFFGSGKAEVLRMIEPGLAICDG